MAENTAYTPLEVEEKADSCIEVENMASSSLEVEAENMTTSSTDSGPDCGSRIVYFVVIPLVLIYGLVVLLDRNPSSSSPWPSLLDTLKSPFPVGADSVPVENVEQAPRVAGAGQPPAAEGFFPVQDNDQGNLTSARSWRNYSELDMVEASLAQVRATMREAHLNNESSFDPDYIPSGPMYRNAIIFHRSFLEMEKLFKIYIYEDGEPPLFHYSKSKGILGIEGILIHHIEISKFRTRDPGKAHVYFFPLSMQSIVDYAYERGNRDWNPVQDIARDYANLIAKKYPYWNRTKGRDHFMLACHDWAPTISHGVAYLWENSIRAMCNANTTEGFKMSIDVSIPEIYLPQGTMDGLLGGPPPSERSLLVFYAGGVHGYIRKVLMEQWKDKDPDVHVSEYLPKHVSYLGMMRKSKYCISPSGWEVADPRMVEAIYVGCVPVLLKDGYAKPFDDVLDWSKFAVELNSSQISDLKNILVGISDELYVEMQKAGLEARRHFEVHFPPKRYDAFHMILHSIWLRRLNIQLYETNES